MTSIPLHRLALVALAALAALVVAASPASATDDPVPGVTPADGIQPGTSPFSGIQPGTSPFSGAPTPSKRRRAGKVRIRLRYGRHGACRGVRVSVGGAGAAGLRRVDIRARGHRIGRDNTRPYRLKLGARRLRGSKKLQIRLVGSDGKVRTLSRRLRSCVRGKLPGHAINDPSFLQPARGMNAIGG